MQKTKNILCQLRFDPGSVINSGARGPESVRSSHTEHVKHQLDSALVRRPAILSLKSIITNTIQWNLRP